MLCAIPRSFKILIAGPAPRAGYFSLFVQRKVTKRKHTRSLAGRKHARSPVPLAPPGRCATRIAVYSAMLKQVLAHIPRWGCGARRALTGLLKSTPTKPKPKHPPPNLLSLSWLGAKRRGNPRIPGIACRHSTATGKQEKVTRPRAGPAIRGKARAIARTTWVPGSESAAAA